MPPTKEPTPVQIPRIDLETVSIRLIGDSPLICHKWSDKAKQMMLDKQQKKASTGKVAKDPDQDYRDSLYTMDDGAYGFPTVAFKAAAVGACRYADMKMTEARGAFHIAGELIPITGTPRMREDMVRVGMGTADIRYRGEFPEWECTLPVTFNTNAISLAQLVNLFNLAGFGVGVGEWRPEKDGSYGRFHVASAEE